MKVSPLWISKREGSTKLREPFAGLPSQQGRYVRLLKLAAFVFPPHYQNNHLRTPDILWTIDVARAYQNLPMHPQC